MLNLRYCIEDEYINNFGDGINPFIFSSFTNKKIICHDVNKKFDRTEKEIDTILGIGSILHGIKEGDIVFGSGIISKDKVPNKPHKYKILAVRGPITRKLLLQKNFECTSLYGDPVLLLPLLIKKPNVDIKYKIGIIPHYIDRDTELVKKILSDRYQDVLLIDIMTSNNPEKIIKQISECEYVFSSTLHGIILCDAYNVKCQHLKLSQKVIGNDLKFKDYYASVNRNYYNVLAETISEPMDLLKYIRDYKCRINLKLLLQAFPYIDIEKKVECTNVLDNGYLSYINSSNII